MAMPPEERKRRQAIIIAAHGKRCYDSHTVRFRYDSGIPAALEAMAQATGTPLAEFIRTATEEQLVKDGWLDELPSAESEDSDTPTEE